MCLILFSYKTHPDYRMILASNRDEFYKRETEVLDYRDKERTILAGRDCENGGTWMAVTASGRFAALTNYRDPSAIKDGAPSRGFLISNFVEGEESPEEYLRSIRENSGAYNGFNLIVGDENDLFYYSNISDKIERVAPGTYGLSNAFMDTPWPKVTKGKKWLGEILSESCAPDTEKLFQMLRSDIIPSDEDLPVTGMGIVWERVLGPLFITSDIYGTRSSAVVTIDNGGKVTFSERTYNGDSGTTPATLTMGFPE